MLSRQEQKAIDELREIVHGTLSTLPFYEVTNTVRIGVGGKSAIPVDFWISYSVEPEVYRRANSHECTLFEACITNGSYYLLIINLAQRLRGLGFGEQLYECNVSIARDFGCFQIVQTPSGWTHSGETRKSYLIRRGWKEHGELEVSKTLIEQNE